MNLCELLTEPNEYADDAYECEDTVCEVLPDEGYRATTLWDSFPGLMPFA